MGFADSIKAFEKKALLAASNNSNTIVKKLFTYTVENSPSPNNPGPYATGLLINQYYPMIAGTSSEISSATSPYGNASLARINDIVLQMPFLGKDNFVTLTNNVDHAYRAEMLGWPAGEGTNGWMWSGRQGPYGMVQKAMIQIQGDYS